MVDVSVIDQLTLEEKILLTAGQDLWRTYALPERKIPFAKTTDGPNGARGGGNFNDSVPAALFPSPSCLASTFDGDLAFQMGKGVALDSRSKQCHVSLAPCINITRDQRYGRAFENYGEDPVLTAHTGADWVRGLQSVGVAATPKHFIANEADIDRRFSNSRVSEAAYREIYLEAFRRLIKEYQRAYKAGTAGGKAEVFAGEPGCIMTSYNRLNGQNTSSDPECAIDILRKDWGFKGLIMSDWFGLHNDALKGTDLEMPGPTIFRSVEAVKAKIAKGELTEQDVTERARKVLELLKKLEPLGLLYDQSEEKEESILDEGRNKDIRTIAAQGTVLLKNEGGLLPLDESIAGGNVKKIALIGTPWVDAIQNGGGSAALTPQKAQAPQEALRQALDSLPNGAGKNVKLVYHPGCEIHRFLPIPKKDGNLVGDVKLEYFDGREYPAKNSSGKVLATHALSAPLVRPSDREYAPPQTSAVNSYALRVTMDIVAKTAGEHTFAMTALGDLVLTGQRANGETAFQTSVCKGETDVFEGFLNPFKHTHEVQVKMDAGEKLRVVLENVPPVLDEELVGALAKAATFHIGFEEYVDRKAKIQEAADVAASSDLAVVIGVLGKDWESEGYDRPHLELPLLQNDLISAVASKQKKTVMVSVVGSAIEMPWLSSVASVVQTWYGGQEAGAALADVLLGQGAAPASGRLCTSWPVSVKDQPAGASPDLFPGVDIGRGHPDVYYKEGRLIGYKWYEKKQIQPAFWFGGGSGGYTTFSRKIESIQQVSEQGEYSVKVTVKNTGKRSGKDVVQVYVAYPQQLVQSAEDFPIKKFAAFKAVHLAAGESKTVEVSLGAEDFSHWVEGSGSWSVEAGKYDVVLGASADPKDEIERQSVDIAKGWTWSGLGKI